MTTPSNALTSARRSTSARLRGIELPLEWQLSSIAAADLALTRGKDKRTTRRLVEHATKLASVGVAK
jgi:hypothetical protein